MRIAKTIDELYEEVKGYDYVITNDAPLATALNAKIDDFRLDGFAYTPKLLAGILETAILKEKALSDLEIISRVERDTGLDFRYIHSEIENIRDIRRYTADVEKFLYSKRAVAVYRSYDSLPTSEKVMSIYDPTIYRSFLDGKRIAVIGLDAFNDLDKHMLPLDFDEIDPFKGDGRYVLKTIHAIGNDRQIAGSIVDLIDIDICNDTAIVFDSGSAVADAVRSALYRKKIPFKNSLDMKDLSQVRDFIQMLELGLDFRTVRVGDVRELISVYQTSKNSNRHRELKPEDDNYLLSRFALDENTEPVTKRLIETMRDIRELTFGYAMDMLFDDMPQKTSVSILLDNMGLQESRVTPALVARLTYAVNNISDLKHNEQVPEYEKKGVLLADCKNAVYVDRPFVIFIGLDESWEVTAAGKDYVDKEQLDILNAQRISILLQQGTSRIYAVKPVTKGKPTLPCSTFQTIYAMDGCPRDIDSFRAICSDYVEGPWFRETSGDRPVSMEKCPESFADTGWKFSKTSYNAYSDCPIKFMFSQLLPGEDRDYTIFGNCLHEFAEFYLCYPEEVRSKGLGYYVERLNDMYAGISNECQRELDVSKFRIYLNNVVRYIDAIVPEKVPLDSPLSARKYPNQFMKDAGFEMCSSLAESKLDSVHPIFAKFDLRLGNLVVDYKTGKAKKASEIQKALDVDSDKLTDVQALIYLQVVSEHTDGPHSFELFFLGENDIESTEEDFDIMRNVRRVRLSRLDRRDVVLGPGGTLYDYLSLYNKYAPYTAKWGEVSDLLLNLEERNEIDSAYTETLLLQIAGKNDNKTNRKDASMIVKKALEQLRSRYLKNGREEVIIPADSMEEFITRLTADRIKAGDEMCIPIYDLHKGSIGCGKCDYRRVCMKADEEEEVSE